MLPLRILFLLKEDPISNAELDVIPPPTVMFPLESLTTFVVDPDG
jgi:hypothetical protein